MAVAQLAWRLLPTLEVCSSNLVISNFLTTIIYFQLYWKDENKEKEAENGPFLNKKKHSVSNSFVLSKRESLDWPIKNKTKLSSKDFISDAVWPEENRKMSIKVDQKWFHYKNDIFWHLYKKCLRMWEIWANLLLPKALKSCPKLKKLPTLVTLIRCSILSSKGNR